jgi:DMSO/TMAO reductase YedYZ molybdopterin-dependent catalytic subunit
MAETKRVPSPTTLTRRTALEWLGGATVLTLGADLVAACNVAENALADAREAGTPDAAVVDTASYPDDWSVPDAGFPFQPGTETHSVYNGWVERTVDSHDLTKILAGWQLTVDGMVQSPLSLKFTDIVALPRQDQVTDLHCVEGWSVYDIPWNGVHLSKLFDQAQVKAGATHVTFHTIDEKYNESLPLAVALEPKTMLAYGAAGSTLPLKHGFPLRVVIPRLLGYKNAKYVARIELTDQPVNGFWVAAGYDYAGEVPKERLRPGKY